MMMLLIGFAIGWLVFKRPDWASNILAKIAEKSRTGIFKF